MITPKEVFLPAVLLAGAAIHSAALGRPADNRTVEAVVAADRAWGAAEARGDAGFVDRLLLAGYRSVDPNGKATSKADILATTRAKGGTPARAAEIAAWRRDHPTRPDVTLFGDTAVLTWVSTGANDAQKIRSSDVFVYRAGSWHAIYSQHSDP